MQWKRGDLSFLFEGADDVGNTRLWVLDNIKRTYADIFAAPRHELAVRQRILQRSDAANTRDTTVAASAALTALANSVTDEELEESEMESQQNAEDALDLLLGAAHPKMHWWSRDVAYEPQTRLWSSSQATASVAEWQTSVYMMSDLKVSSRLYLICLSVSVSQS